MAAIVPSDRKNVCPKGFATPAKKKTEADKDPGRGRRRLQALPFSAGANTLSRKAGLLTRPPRRRLPGPGGPVAQECRNGTNPCGRDSQQRELSPIHTAFPFNSPPRGNHCPAKVHFSPQEASAPAEYFRRTHPAVPCSSPFRPRCAPFPATGGATLARALYLFRSTAAQQPQ